MLIVLGPILYQNHKNQLPNTSSWGEMNDDDDNNDYYYGN